MKCFSTVAGYARSHKMGVATAHRHRLSGQLNWLRLHRPFVPCGGLRSVEEAVIAITQSYLAVLDEEDIKTIFGLRCPKALNSVTHYLQLQPMNGLRPPEYLRDDLILAISQIYEQQEGVNLLTKIAHHNQLSQQPLCDLTHSFSSCPTCGHLYD